MGLLLYQLTKLLEVRIIAQELKAAESFATSGVSATRATTLISGLGSGLKEIAGLLTTSSRGSGTSRSGGLGLGLILLLLLLLFLDVIGDSLPLLAVCLQDLR